MADHSEISMATDAEYTQIDQLLRAAFNGPDEAGLVKRLRSQSADLIELIAKSGGQVVGHICLSRLDEPAEWGALAPLSVAANFRRIGIGASLVCEAIRQAEAARWPALVVLGDPSYYNRFGFDVEKATGFTSLYPIKYTGILELSAFKEDKNKRITYSAAFAGD